MNELSSEILEDALNYALKFKCAIVSMSLKSCSSNQ